MPTSSSSSRWAVSSTGSSATSRLPAGTSSSSASMAARYWRTRITSPSGVTGTTTTAPGWWTTSRSNSLPSGSTNVPNPADTSVPAHCGRSPTLRKPIESESEGGGVELQQPGGSTLGPAQGGGHEGGEQGVGPVGAALELGMGLGANPERVVGQLDELDQPVVGRGADRLEPA